MQMKMESNEVQTPFQQQCLLNSNFKWMNDLQKEVKEAKQKAIELQNTLKIKESELKQPIVWKMKQWPKWEHYCNKFVAQWSVICFAFDVCFFSLSPQQFDSSVKRLLATLYNNSEHNSNTKSQSWSSSRSLQPQLWQKMTNSELSKPSCQWLTNWQKRRQDWDWALWKPTKTLHLQIVVHLAHSVLLSHLSLKKKTKTKQIWLNLSLFFCFFVLILWKYHQFHHSQNKFFFCFFELFSLFFCFHIIPDQWNTHFFVSHHKK